MMRVLLGSALAASAAGLAVFLAPTVAGGPDGEPIVVARSASPLLHSAALGDGHCPFSRDLVLSFKGRLDENPPIADGEHAAVFSEMRVVILLGPVSDAARPDEPKPERFAEAECDEDTSGLMQLGSI